MAAFQFRLQRLLALRRTERAARASELAQAQAELQSQHRQLEQSAAQRAQLLATAQGGPGTPVDVATWSARRADYQSARRLEADAVARWREAAAHVAQAQGAYLEARRGQRVLDRLRQRRHEEWRAGQASAAQAEADEFASRRRNAPPTAPRREGS